MLPPGLPVQATWASTLPNHNTLPLAIHHTPPKTSAYLYKTLVTTALPCLLLGLKLHCGPGCIKSDFSMLLLRSFYTHHLRVQSLGSHHSSLFPSTPIILSWMLKDECLRPDAMAHHILGCHVFTIFTGGLISERAFKT